MKSNQQVQQVDHKDSNVDIYMEINKTVYKTGQYVEGRIHVTSRSSSPYYALFLRLTCQEECYWEESDGDFYSDYENKINPYHEILTVHEFSSQMVSQGQFVFPFKLLIPSDFPGSFKQDERNRIQYNLCAELTPIVNSSVVLYPQKHQVILNIVEPVRISIGQTSTENINQVNSFVCCCCRYGKLKYTISTQQNVVKPGESTKVYLLIDNTQGSAEVQDLVVLFKKATFKISSKGRANGFESKKMQVYRHPTKIPAQSRQKVLFSFTIPQDFSTEPTAIGTIVARIYGIAIQSIMGWCTVGPLCQHHVIFQPNNQTEENRQTTFSNDKNKQIFRQKVFKDYKMFNYILSPQMIWLNRESKKSMNNANNLKNMKGYGDKSMSKQSMETYRQYSEQRLDRV